ncbi:hypothetical protein ACFWPK_04160 [Nocardia sp. NPDC058519]|uniref:hypothetical protein n=1 Tax=Nocardia sp. NPDC058519 TaxID=3346535 RepID=UPI003652DE41
MIALTIGLGEDRVDLDTGLADLRDVGSADEADAVGRALGSKPGRTMRALPPGR